MRIFFFVDDCDLFCAIIPFNVVAQGLADEANGDEGPVIFDKTGGIGFYFIAIDNEGNLVLGVDGAASCDKKHQGKRQRTQPFFHKYTPF